MHDDVGDRCPDVDQHLAAAFVEQAFGCEASQHRERIQVQSRRFQLRGRHHLEQRVDHLTLRGDEQDSAEPVPLLVVVVLQRVKVQDRLVDRNGDGVLCLELQRTPQLVVGQIRKVELAHDDLLVGHAQVHALGLEPVARPERAQRLRHRPWLYDLAVADRSRWQHHLTKAVQGRRATAPSSHLHRPHRT